MSFTGTTSASREETHPLALGENNCGKGVGGGSVHWAAFAPRFSPLGFPHLLRRWRGRRLAHGVSDLKPWYELLEREIPVAGPAWFPWGNPHGHPYGPHPLGGVGNILVRGCTKLGIRTVTGGPVAILSASHGDRPHCIHRGFCLQGCKVGAKASTLITHVPDAIANGAEIRPHAMASRINLRDDGRVNGVVYLDREGREHFQKARAVIVSGYAIETPRLLFNSACPGHSRGLANSSGTLGKYLMAQAGNVIAGRFDELIRLYKAPPAHALSEEFYETDPQRGFARGFAIQTVGPLPVAFAKHMIAAMGAWGWGLRRVMMDYNRLATIGVLGEILPWEDTCIELAEEKDQYGLRVAKVTLNLHDNDKKLIEFRKEKGHGSDVGSRRDPGRPGIAFCPPGWRGTHGPGSCHVCGGQVGRTHDVPNLFVCDGSILPTQGSANPGLTIQALAARTADYLIKQGDAIFFSSRRDLQEPPIRYDLSPPFTRFKGNPGLPKPKSCGAEPGMRRERQVLERTRLGAC